MQINSSKLPIKLELSLILWSPNDLASPAEVNPTPQQHQPLRFLKLNKTIFLSSTSFDLFNLNLLYVTFTQLLLFFLDMLVSLTVTGERYIYRTCSALPRFYFQLREPIWCKMSLWRLNTTQSWILLTSNTTLYRSIFECI